MSLAMLHVGGGSDLTLEVAEWCEANGVTTAWVTAQGAVRSVAFACGTSAVSWGPSTLASLTGVFAGGELNGSVVVASDAGGLPVTAAGRFVRAACDGVWARVESEATFAAATARVRELAERPPTEPARQVVAPAPAPPPRPAPAPAPPVARPTIAPAPAVPPRQPASPMTPERAAIAAAAARPGGPPRAEPAPASAWANVAKASQAFDDGGDDELDVEDLERGDVLLHPSLAKCTVVSIVGEDAVQVRLANGSVRKLKMTEFRLFREGDTRTFRIARKEPR